MATQAQHDIIALFRFFQRWPVDFFFAAFVHLLSCFVCILEKVVYAPKTRQSQRNTPHIFVGGSTNKKRKIAFLAVNKIIQNLTLYFNFVGTFSSAKLFESNRFVLYRFFIVIKENKVTE